MSTDRELLELAAKAAEFEYRWLKVQGGQLLQVSKAGSRSEESWNPLTDDGDALRLAVDLRMSISYGLRENTVYVGTAETAPWREVALSEQGIPAATRRAIVRAAAEIGRAMP